MEGSGSVQINYGYGCGYRRPKNIRILRIRIRNTAFQKQTKSLEVLHIGTVSEEPWMSTVFFVPYLIKHRNFIFNCIFYKILQKKPRSGSLSGSGLTKCESLTPLVHIATVSWTQGEGKECTMKNKSTGILFAVFNRTKTQREPKHKQFHWDERKQNQRQTFRIHTVPGIYDQGCGSGVGIF